MAKPKKSKAAKPKSDKKTTKKSQGYEIKAKIAEQRNHWVRLAMTDRNNIGVDVYEIVKVMRGEVVAMGQVHQQTRDNVGKRVVSLSKTLADTISCKDGNKVVVQKPTRQELEQFRANMMAEG